VAPSDDDDGEDDDDDDELHSSSSSFNSIYQRSMHRLHAAKLTL